MVQLAWENYWYQIEVNWHQCWANLSIPINSGSGQDDDSNSQFFGPVPGPALVPMGWPWLENLAPVEVNQQPGGRLQQQATQQHATQQAVARQPVLPQPIVQQQQPMQQQSSAQQPGMAKVRCPVHDCTHLIQPSRNHLYDHLAENHGYDKTAREYSINPKHIKRKSIATLHALFIRNTRKLPWSKARLLASEEAIRQADPSYVSGHGLGLTMEAYSIPKANA